MHGYDQICKCNATRKSLIFIIEQTGTRRSVDLEAIISVANVRTCSSVESDAFSIHLWMIFNSQSNVIVR